MITLIYDYLIWQIKVRAGELVSLNGICNLVFGIVSSAVTVCLLKKEAGREDSHFTFYKNQVLPTCLWLIVEVVLITPPFPAESHIWGRVLGYGVFYIVFSVTSCTDKQTGMFRAGYMMVGVFVTVVLALFRLPGWLREGEGSSLLLAGAVMVCNLLLGTFVYRFGDALLYLMTQFSMLLCLSPRVWMAAMVVGLVSAMAYSVVLYTKEFIVKKGNIKSRFPFTRCLFFGSLTAMFLFL